jgi:ATP-binding cassette subfamily C protein PrsD
MTTLQAAQRNAEVVRALGMTATLADRWLARNMEYRSRSQQNADVANAYFALSKIFRLALQSAVLAAGAALVIENQASAGVIIASSILTARALSPVEQAIANARGYASARQSWRRIQEILKALPQIPFPTFLPAPRRSLIVEALASGAPGEGSHLVSGISFSVAAGSAVGVVGPSASGKSTLARALTGVWPILHGGVRLDGAALDQWDEGALGRYIGYLPQDIELFAGTVADNISRFQPNAASDDIIAAARAAGVHDLILRLANGYDTEIGAGGSMLSAGQRQRIGLARALYGDPFLVVLDEPNSNLDADGEAAVSAAITGVRSRGGIAIVIAHRPSALSATDYVLMIRDGHMHLFGRKEEVLNSIIAKNIRSVSVERSGALRVTGAIEESAS